MLNRGQSKLEKKHVVMSIENFHKALGCLKSLLNNTGELNRNEGILENSDVKNFHSHKRKSNQFGSKRPGLNRTKKDQNSRLSKEKKCNLSKLSHSKQSVSKRSENLTKKVEEWTITNRRRKNWRRWRGLVRRKPVVNENEWRRRRLNQLFKNSYD